MPRSLAKEDLPALAKWLEDYQPFSFKMYSMVQTSIQELFFNDFWVDQWPNVTCVISKPSNSDEKTPVVYCIFRSNKSSLGVLLDYPGVIDWSKRGIFQAWAQDDIEVMTEIGLRHGCVMKTKATGDMYILNDDLETHLEVPVGMSLGPLLSEHAALVKERWQYGYNYSFSYIRDLIERLPTVCLYDTNGKPIGFELTREYGSMGVLYVTPEHRKKGLARLLTLSLARKIRDLGRIPFVFIVRDNEPSLCLHQSLGFRQVPDNCLIWVASTPK